MAPEAQEAAQKAIAEIEVLRLSRQAQEQFATVLLNPPAPGKALARAFERHRELLRNTDVSSHQRVAQRSGSTSARAR